MSKALIILAEGFEEIEALATVDVLRRANFDVTIAGLDRVTVIGGHKIVINCDTELSNIDPLNYDVLILPGGGEGTRRLGESQKVINLVRDYKKADRYIAAICAAPSVLAKAKILEGHTATVYPGLESSFDKGVYVDKDIVVSGKIITARGPGISINFALTIVEKMVGADLANDLSKQMINKR